mmetsp:Transcript_1177/g.1848  ORF Transcript_1177/g.1848 Transcript_1177/m.1848 type:complete len:122 (-) Transcript_1177:284-649(-)
MHMCGINQGRVATAMDHGILRRHTAHHMGTNPKSMLRLRKVETMSWRPCREMTSRAIDLSNAHLPCKALGIVVIVVGVHLSLAMMECRISQADVHLTRTFPGCNPSVMLAWPWPHDSRLTR